MTTAGTHIVLTTIGDGGILLDLAQNAARYGRQAVVWVIADRKTPPECAWNCAAARDLGLDARYLSPAGQDEAMQPFPVFYARLPWDSDARRNIGYLLALREACERLILLDDDNFPGDSDFIGGHEVVGSEYQGPAASDETGYYDYLRNHSDSSLSPRGFPYFARGAGVPGAWPVKGRIAANLGAWVGDPDVDALAWLSSRPKVARWFRLPFVLAPHTWTPINSQNACIHRDLIPAAFFVVQRYPGLPIMDRFGDIFAGYFLQAVMGKDDLVQVGPPVARHRRNHHHHMADLVREAPAIAILEWLLPELRTFESGAGAVSGRYLDLAAWLAELAPPGSLPAGAGMWLAETARSMELYAHACRQVIGERA